MELDIRLQKIYKQMEQLEEKEDWMALRSLYAEALSLSLKIYGAQHEETLALYTEYGGLLRNLGLYEQALPLLQKALTCARALKGENHPDYASALINLANLFRMMHYFTESEHLFLQAKKIYERTIGKDAFLYASLCNNLGLLYQDQGLYAKAIPLHEKSLSILKDDPEHVLLYGITLNNLTEPYKTSGKRGEAKKVLSEAIDIFREHLSLATVLYAAAMNNLGIFYYEEENYEKAKECFELSLKISREKLGTESESYKNSLKNYKQVIEKMEAYPKEQRLPDLHIAIAQSAFQSSTREPLTKDSKGLDLCEAYFWDVCYPMLEKEFKPHLNRMAAGLVGEGSECYGYDDSISRDHDFGPSFQLFLPACDLPVYGEPLKEKIDMLSKAYGPFESRQKSTYGGNRIGIWSIEDFYEKYLSIHEAPTTNKIWVQMEDIPLSTATNGRVFFDNLGEFTRIRKDFLKHYPRDVRLKKLAFCCMQIAQSGQYNLSRSLKRGQYVAAFHALNEFVTYYSSFVYLANKTYRPYYKWEQEGLKKLPLLGAFASRELGKLVLIPLKEKPQYAIFVVENLCEKIIIWLKEQHLSESTSDFLLAHGPEILLRIEDPSLRNSNPWLER